MKKDPFKINDRFFNKYQDLVCDVMLPFQYDVLADTAGADIEKSHAIENFRIAAGEADGEHYGMVFQDSDVAKWLEALAYSLLIKPNALLEAKADEVIRLIGKAQTADGYLNSFYTIKHPEKRWQNLHEDHELYCMGHMIEAGVAYYEATGKEALLTIAKKMADLIYDTFGHAPGKQTGVPGHPEIELALLRLYRTTADRRYLEAAQYFIDERGQNPRFFEEERRKRGWVRWGDINAEIDTNYAQVSHPVREEQHAVGHAVRAVYLYTGMAMAARETGDRTLLMACERMWDSIVNRRMYITGGIGSSAPGHECFTADYDLPNDTAYNETCASIALIFFAKEMLALTHQAQYADVMERSLYNTVLAGIGLDGRHFFYTNPLDFDPAYAEEVPVVRHIKKQRPHWYACACCPPNAARLLASLGRYAFHADKDALYADLFIGGEYVDEQAHIVVSTDFPHGDTVTYQIKRISPALSFYIRVPGWSKKNTFSVNAKETAVEINKGYAKISGLATHDTLSFTMDISPKKVYARVDVAANLGKYAVIAGALCYCFEDADNDDEINRLMLLGDAVPSPLTFVDDILGDIKAIKIAGVRLDAPADLYSYEAPEATTYTLTGIPYHVWGNRGLGRMKVWLPEF